MTTLPPRKALVVSETMHMAIKMNAEAQRENAKWPTYMVQVPDVQVKSIVGLVRTPDALWRSRFFVAQVFNEAAATRITVWRTTLKLTGDYDDRITWDELQQIKSEIGFGNRCAVELYPPDDQMIDDVNVRHLWILPEPPEYMMLKQADDEVSNL